MSQENTTMIQRVQIVITKHIEKMPLHLQMIIKPFLNQFHLFSEEVDDNVILDFIKEIETNIAYIKGTDIDAD